MKKIVFIGGGSAKFVTKLVRDMFTFPALQELQITLMDIAPERMERTEQLLQMVIAEQGLPATVECTTDQRAALAGADYVIVTIMVGGFEKYYSDGAIPASYGVLPTVGDTIGPGGVFRLIRTQPVLQQIADNLREVAPQAWVLNYSNPMAMNMLALDAAGHTRSVGLCHSIQYTYQELARWCGVPEAELDRVRYTAGGINHVNFYLTLEYQGRNLYEELLANKDALIAAHPQDRVRFELLENLGYWPAEGPHHQSEYYPWFRKNPAAADYYGLDTLFGYHTDMRMNEELEAEVDQQIQAGRVNEWERSLEYGAYIINALEGGAPQLFYGNVPNADLITNLPRHAVVEVPCLAEANGIFPCHVGEVPPQLAAVQTPHIAVHQLALAGVQARSRRLIRQAIQADPLTGAILTLAQIREMVEELFAANEDYTADWPRE